MSSLGNMEGAEGQTLTFPALFRGLSSTAISSYNTGYSGYIQVHKIHYW